MAERYREFLGRTIDALSWKMSIGWKLPISKFARLLIQVAPQIDSELDRSFGKLTKVRKVRMKRAQPTSEYCLTPVMNRLQWPNRHQGEQISAHRVQRPTFTDKYGQVIAQKFWQDVNPVLNFLSTWQERLDASPQCVSEANHICDRKIGIEPRSHMPGCTLILLLYQKGQLGNFINDKPRNDSRISFSLTAFFIPLLLSNLNGLLRRLVGKSGDSDCRRCGNCSYNDRGPVRQISPVRCQGTDFYRHKPSVSDPILP